MKILLKLIVFIVPTSFIFMFFMLLTNDKSYPGADYTSFKLPSFKLENLENLDIISNDVLEGDSTPAGVVTEGFIAGNLYDQARRGRWDCSWIGLGN